MVFLLDIEIIEEYAAYAAGFLPVWDVEVLIAPLLEARIVIPVMFVASILDASVEMDRVFVVQVTGGQIGAAAEPPGVAFPVFVHGLEVAVVEVHRGRVGVLGVQHQAQAGGEELEAVDVWVDGFVVYTHFLDRRAREGAVDDGGVDAGFLEDGAVLLYAGYASSACWARPCIGSEFVGWVEFL